MLLQQRMALDAVDFVTFFEQEFGKVGTVLAGNAGDEGGFLGLGGHGWFLEHFKSSALTGLSGNNACVALQMGTTADIH